MLYQRHIPVNGRRCHDFIGLFSASAVLPFLDRAIYVRSRNFL
ncbi:hypothetical protein [Microcoleus sp. herbarium14]